MEENRVWSIVVGNEGEMYINNQTHEILMRDEYNVERYVPLTDDICSQIGIANPFLATASAIGTDYPADVSSMDTYASNEDQVAAGQKAKWDTESTKCLIEIYKMKKHKFNGPMRNVDVWREIADEINKTCGPYTATHCENKFNYENKRYIKKKENMGSKSSGAGAIRCQFFEEYEEIFGKKPNIIPPNIASSSRGWDSGLDVQNTSDILGQENVSETQPEEADIEKPAKRVRRENPVVSILRENQSDRRERHKEKLDQIARMETKRNELFREMMEKLIAKL